MDNREDVGEYYPGGSVVPAKPEPAAHPVESVNGKAGAVVLTAADVGALPDTTEIPDAEKVSSWGFLRKAWSDLVAAFAAKVHRHTIGQVDGLQSELSTLDQKATEASDLAASAQGTADSAAQQVSGAYAAASTAELKAGNAYTTAMVADSKASTAKLTAENALSTAESKASASELSDLSDYVDLVEERRDQNERSITRAFAEIATKLDSDETAADSAMLGGVAASGYALKTDVPKRVSNDTDTVRIDGEGNVYDVTNTPTDNYITVTYNTGTVRRYNYNRLSSSYYEYKWTGGNEYLNYRQSDGRISNQSGLQIAVANSGVDPLDDEQIVVSSISATSITSIVHTPQKSAKTEIKTDRLTRESELDDKVSKTGDTMTGPLKLKTTWLHLFYGGSEVSSDEEYYLKLHYDGTITHVNPDTGDGEIHVNTLPEKDGTLLVDSDVAVAKTLSGTYVTLTDRDCATVNYAAGLTLAFANASGLRQFEILIKGCVADGSIGVPSKVYRGSSDAFKLEAGDNHLSFAEQADGSFIVHRMLANTITIGG